MPVSPYLDKPTSPENYEYNEDGWTPEGSGGSQTGGNYQTKTCKLVINYYANGATGNPPSSTVKTYSGTKKAITLDALVKNQGAMTYTGYYFLGWSTSASSRTVVYNPGDTISNDWTADGSGTKTYNLYAVWTDHSIFVYKPGSYANEASLAYHDKYSDKPLNQATTLKGALFTRKGYTQTGWQLGDGSTKYNLNQSYTATSDAVVELYPVWTAKTHTITFKAGAGGTGRDVSKRISYDSDFTVPTQYIETGNTFYKTGYHLSVWNEQEDGKGSSWYPGLTYVFKRDEDITLYAFWTGNEYYILYDEEGETSYITGLLSFPYLSIDSQNRIYSETEDLNVDSNGILNTGIVQYSVDQTRSANYSIATYGSPFYTDRQPPFKEGQSFVGWKDNQNTVWVKQNAWLNSYSRSSDPIWTTTYNLRLTPIWSDAYPYGKIFLAGKESTDYGIVVEEPPNYSWPALNYKHEQVNGLNGDILTDPGRYGNAQKTYKVAVIHNEGFYAAASNLSEFVHRRYNTTDYVRIQDTYEPDVYMMGVYEESAEAANLLGQAGRATIKFSCKPQKFLLSGDDKIDIVNGQNNCNNPTNYPAAPILKIWGTGTIRIFGRPDRHILGDNAPLKTVDLVILKNYNTIILDCETFDAVDEAGHNRNDCISLYEPIRFYPGGNGMRLDETISRISVTPRWWKL